MKTLSFQPLAEETVGIDGCATPSICRGFDGRVRIAVSGSRVIRYARKMASGKWRILEVARASSFPGVVDVADGVSITSSSVADVVAGRCRTKGSGNDTYHGPWMTVIPSGASKPGPMTSRLFTTGGCRAIFDNPVPRYVELWSKDGNWRVFDVTTGLVVDSGRDNIGATGEKMAVAPAGWRAMNGCASRDNSRVIHRGEPAVTWLDADTYDVGADERYPGLCVRLVAKQPVAYLASYVAGQLLVNKVRNGRAIFNPAKLPSIGASSRTDRHPPQLVAVRGRVAAFWTVGDSIVGVDVDGAVAGLCKPVVVAQGQLAAACGLWGKVGLAIVRGGSLYYKRINVKKG